MVNIISLTHTVEYHLPLKWNHVAIDDNHHMKNRDPQKPNIDWQ